MKEMNPELTTNIHTSSYFGIIEEKLGEVPIPLGQFVSKSLFDTTL